MNAMKIPVSEIQLWIDIINFSLNEIEIRQKKYLLLKERYDKAVKEKSRWWHIFEWDYRNYADFDKDERDFFNWYQYPYSTKCEFEETIQLMKTAIEYEYQFILDQNTYKEIERYGYFKTTD